MIQQHSSDSTPLSEDNADVDESCSKENDENNSVDSEGAKNENNVFDDMLETLLQLEMIRASISGGRSRKLHRRPQPAVRLPLPYPKQEVKISNIWIHTSFCYVLAII